MFLTKHFLVCILKCQVLSKDSKDIFLLYLGQILNRFAEDIFLMDEELPARFFDVSYVRVIYFNLLLN